MARLTRRYHIPSALRPSPARIEVATARELVAAGAVLIDVRRHEDHTEPINGAARIPPDEIPAHLAGFARGVPIVLACT